MHKVLGIGGFFFRATDPDALGRWYEATFGINKVGDDYDDPAWEQEGGTTVFAPFKQDTTYFGRPEQQWMINLRVHDLDATVGALRDAGINVDVDPERYPNGRFARLTDPEGNPIELWQEMPRP
jgi:predicted enzyme related to lactoylglutathione lyase